MIKTSRWKKNMIDESVKVIKLWTKIVGRCVKNSNKQPNIFYTIIDICNL